MVGRTSLTGSQSLLTVSASCLTGSRTGVTGMVAVATGTGRGLLVLSDKG